MNFEKLQEMIKDVISRELLIEFEYDLKYMTEDEKRKNDKYRESILEMIEILESKLNEEDGEILRDLVDTLSLQGLNEAEYYFERGVRCAFTSLKYLKKYCKFF